MIRENLFVFDTVRLGKWYPASLTTFFLLLKKKKKLNSAGCDFIKKNKTLPTQLDCINGSKSRKIPLLQLQATHDIHSLISFTELVGSRQLGWVQDNGKFSRAWSPLRGQKSRLGFIGTIFKGKKK